MQVSSVWLLRIGGNCTCYSTFSKILKDKKVLVKTDNTTVVTSINKQWGTYSSSFMYSGLGHVPADHQQQDCLNCSTYSRKSQHIDRFSVSKIQNIQPTEWTLNEKNRQYSLCEENHKYPCLQHDGTVELRTLFCQFQTSLSWQGLVAYVYDTL